jgi:two-component system response regulator HydG
MPTLQERAEDIPLLAEYFLKVKAKSKNVKQLSPAALRLLATYPWPGNIRELEHVIEGAILLSSGNLIEDSDLQLYVQRPAALPPPGPLPATGSLEDLERRHIERVLEENRYNRARTAERLGISKKTLYLKIKRYGLVVPD